MPARFRSLLAVVAIACAVRTAYLIFILRSPINGTYRIDQLYYRTWGLKIAGGGWIGREVYEQGPLYAYLLGIYYRLAGPAVSDVWLFMLQLLMGVLTVGLIWDLAHRLFGPCAAVVSSVLAAVFGPAIFYECMLMKTFLEPLFVVAALYAAVRAVISQRPMGWWLTAGACIGFASLVREVHLLLLLPLVVAAFRRRAEDAKPGPTWLRACIPLAGTLLVILPVSLRNYAVAGEFAAVTAAGGENFYLAYGPYARGFYLRPPFLQGTPYQEHQDFRDELFLRTRKPHGRADSSRYWFRQGLASVLRRPRRALTLAWQRTILLLNDFEFPDNENYPVTRDLVAPLRWLPTVGCVVGLGLVGMARAAGRLRHHLLPLGFSAALALEIILTFDIGRYRAAFAPMLILYAGPAVTGLVAAARRRSYANLSVTVVAALALSLAAFLPPPELDPAVREREFGAFRKGIAEASAALGRIPSLEASLKANPKNPVLWITYGATLEKTGRFPEADRAYLAAAQVAPRLPEPRFARAWLLLRQGEIEAAETEARATAALAPRHARSHLVLGRIALWKAAGAATPLEAHRNVREAAGHLHRALELDKSLADAYAKLGRAYILLGAPQQALGWLEEGLRLNPSSLESMYLRDYVRHPQKLGLSPISPSPFRTPAERNAADGP